MSYHDPALLPPDVPRLKKRTKYRCPNGIGLGHGSKWTGDLGNGQRPTDHLCPCGAAYVEVVEDGFTYRVQWEMIGPYEFEYHERHRDTTDRAEAIDQWRTLRQWEETGVEPVRNARLLRAETVWTDYDPEAGQ